MSEHGWNHHEHEVSESEAAEELDVNAESESSGESGSGEYAVDESTVEANASGSNSEDGETESPEDQEVGETGASSGSKFAASANKLLTVAGDVSTFAIDKVRQMSPRTRISVAAGLSALAVAGALFSRSGKFLQNELPKPDTTASAPEKADASKSNPKANDETSAPKVADAEKPKPSPDENAGATDPAKSDPPAPEVASNVADPNSPESMKPSEPPLGSPESPENHLSSLPPVNDPATVLAANTSKEKLPEPTVPVSAPDGSGDPAKTPSIAGDPPLPELPSSGGPMESNSKDKDAKNPPSPLVAEAVVPPPLGGGTLPPAEIPNAAPAPTPASEKGNTPPAAEPPKTENPTPPVKQDGAKLDPPAPTVTEPPKDAPAPSVTAPAPSGSEPPVPASNPPVIDPKPEPKADPTPPPGLPPVPAIAATGATEKPADPAPPSPDMAAAAPGKPADPAPPSPDMGSKPAMPDAKLDAPGLPQVASNSVTPNPAPSPPASSVPPQAPTPVEPVAGSTKAAKVEPSPTPTAPLPTPAPISAPPNELAPGTIVAAGAAAAAVASGAAMNSHQDPPPATAPTPPAKAASDSIEPGFVRIKNTGSTQQRDLNDTIDPRGDGSFVVSTSDEESSAVSPTPLGSEFAAESNRKFEVETSAPKTKGRSIQAKADPKPAKVEATLHTVEKQESFLTLSRLYYGDDRYARALWAANRDTVPATNELRVGQILIIPAPEDLDASLIAPPGAQVASSSRASTKSAESPSTGKADLKRTTGTPRSPSRAKGIDLMAERQEEDIERDTRFASSGRSGSSSFKSNGSSSNRSLGRERDIDEDLDRVSNTSRSRNADLPAHKIRKGETLRSIARDRLGDSHRADEILELNPSLGENPKSLPPGQIIDLPEDAKPGRR